jgi:hypothetical protein
MKRPTPLSLIGPGADRPAGRRRGADVQLALADAYRSVFFGNPTNAQRDMVFVHLANASGYYRVTGPGMTPDERSYNEGRRSLFGEIVAKVYLTDNERAALEIATRSEALTDAYELSI